MLSYRHAFHAGNAADVLKHTVLAFCLRYLGQKEKAYTYIDTHAGPGLVTLGEGYAAQNREWEKGVLPVKKHGLEGDLFAPYSEALGKYPDGLYPGSPLIAKNFLRPRDSACFFELHPGDFSLLVRNLVSPNEKTAGFHPRVIKRDGLSSLKALLPPASRRACVFIDPSYEIKEDYARLSGALGESLRRFPGGVYIVWFPLLGRKEARELPETLMSGYGGRRCLVSLATSPASLLDRGMYGSGLVVYNPPWTLRAALETGLPELALLLGHSPGSYSVRWEEA